MNGIIFDLQRASFVDGPGIRTTVFFKGCNLNCLWCHNPEGINPKRALLRYSEKCSACGKCVAICPTKQSDCMLCGKCALLCPNDALELCGRIVSVDDVFAELEKDRAYYEKSGGGITFSGGECMLQIDFLEELLKKCKNANISMAIDTAGNVAWSHFERVIPYTDIFLYDVKCILESLHIQGTGVSNKLIKENLIKLASQFPGKIVVRIPVIGGYNATHEEMNAIAEFLAPLNISQVELLPYHKLGMHKSEAAGVSYKEFTEPPADFLTEWKNRLNSAHRCKCNP